MGRFGLIACVVAGCGFRPIAGVADGGDGDAKDAPPGAEAGTPTCLERWMSHTIRFAAPVAFPELTSSDVSFDRDPFVSQDERTIYWSSNRATSSNADIWTATRSSPTATWGTPAKFAIANSGGYEGKLSMTMDQLVFTVTSDRGGGVGQGDIWGSVRGTAGMPFPAPTEAHFANVNTIAAENDGLLSGDGLRIYLAPPRSATEPQHIVAATRPSRGADFSSPSSFPELDSGTGDADPALSNDERIIVFSSNRPGNAGAVDLWYATRVGGVGTPFSTPLPVPDVNTGANEGDPWLSADGCRLYFASDTASVPYDYGLFIAAAR